jgi:limonene-1,2-epoxide hydrolase
MERMATAAPTPKQVVKRYLKAMTHGKPGDLTKVVTPDVSARQGEERVDGVAAAEAFAAHYRAAFPGWKFEVERMVAEGAWVAVSGYSVAGELRLPWMAHYRVTRGRVAEVNIVAETARLTADTGIKATLAV